MRTRMYANSYAVPGIAADEYARLTPNAAACLACSGEPCATACPNGIPISDWTRETHRDLG